MVLFNHSTRELTAKIVYYGPGLCGKTTNLKVLHERLDRGTTGRLLSLATAQDRTIYFDLLPVELGNVKGYTVRFQLCTVPGQVFYNETRKLVLRGVDGIVFVVDSQWSMLSQNLESYQNLRDNLREGGTPFEDLPLVVQYNKRDLPGVLGVGALAESLAIDSYPYVEAVASQGKGVVETFKLISKLTFVNLLKRLQKSMGVDAGSWEIEPLSEASTLIAPEERTVQVEGVPPPPTPPPQSFPSISRAIERVPVVIPPAGPAPPPVSFPTLTTEPGEAPPPPVSYPTLTTEPREAPPSPVQEPAGPEEREDETAPFSAALEPQAAPSAPAEPAVPLAAFDELARRVGDIERKLARPERTSDLEASVAERIAGLERKIEQGLEQLRADGVESRRTLAAETARLSDQAARQEDAASALRDDLDRIPAELEALRTHASTHASTLAATLASTLASTASTTVTRDQHGSDLVLLKDEVTTELKKLLGSALDGLLEDRGRERAEADAVRAAAAAEVAALGGELTSVRSELGAALEEARAGLESLRSQIAGAVTRDQLGSDIVLLKDELVGELKGQIVTLRSERASERQEAEAALASSREEIAALKAELAASGRKTGKLFEGIRRALAENDGGEGTEPGGADQVPGQPGASTPSG